MVERDPERLVKTYTDAPETHNAPSPESLFGRPVTVQEVERLPRAVDQLPTGYCQHGSGTMYSVKAKTYFPAPCNIWRYCDPCRVWLARRFAKQVQYEIQQAGKLFGWYIVAQNEWSKKQQWLRDHGMRYRAFPRSTGDALLVVTHYPEPGKNRLPLDEGNLALWVYNRLLEIPTARRPSASRDFGGSRYKGTRPTGSGSYRRTSNTPQQVEDNLLEAALKKLRTDGGWVSSSELAKLQQYPSLAWSYLTNQEAEAAICAWPEPTMDDLLPGWREPRG
jgi:hypothetical protein